MFHKLHNPNEFINKITKNFNFDTNGRIVMSSPTSPKSSPAPSQDPSQYQHKVRAHTVSSENRPAKIIPLQETQESIASKEMKDIAFEVKDNQNLHPLDEPFILRNGKKIFPSTVSPKAVNGNNLDKVNFDDLLNIVYNIWKFLRSLVMSFWNLDLYVNIDTSKDSTMKVHIPTVIISLVSLKILHSICYPSHQETISVLSAGSSSSSSSGPSLIPVIIVLSSLGYWFAYHYHPQFTSDSTDPVSESATLVGSIKTPNPGLIPDLDCVSTNSDTDTLIGSSFTKKMNNIWSNEPSSSNVIELETIVNKNKQPIEKTFHPIHRQELKQKNQKNRLNLNLPLSPKKVYPNNCDFHEMTQLGREEMLKAFNL